MVRKAGIVQQNIYVSLLLLFAIASQVIFLTDSGGYFTVFMPLGIAAAFYVTLGKKVFPGLAITTFLGFLLFTYFFTDKNFTDAILYTIPVLFINAIGSLSLKFFLNLFKCNIPDSLRKGTLYIISLIFVAVLASIFPALLYSGLHRSNFFYELWIMYQPIYIGLGVFTTLIILSHRYDELLTSVAFGKYREALFFIVFSVITYFIFNNNSEQLDFWTLAPIIIVLFVTNAFVFNYRMLLVISYMFIFIYKVTYLDILIPTNNTDIQALLNMYLAFLLIITIFTKILVRQIHEKNKELTETKERFSGMLDSTISLLSIRETITYDDTNYHEAYINNIFDIAMKIFPEIKHGIAAIHSSKEVRVLNSKGYDLEFLKILKIPTNRYNYTSYSPSHSMNPMKDFADALGERYPLFKDEIPHVKESVRIMIKLGEGYNGIILFDILEKSGETFTENDINNIAAFQNMINSFYDMNELAIKNNNLKDDIVLSLIRTLELYDQYTGGHSEDVATIAKLIAEKLKLPDNDIYDIYWAGIVHDIGKIGIKSEIINKPTRLTLEEYKQVQQHPVFGFDVLNRSSELMTIAKLVKHHHEWWNGSGYPEGLKDDEIPLGSQILQVADSVSSMATKRSYQNKKSFEQIIEELEMYKGTQFNPVICDHMIDLIKSGIIENYFNSQQKK